MFMTILMLLFTASVVAGMVLAMLMLIGASIYDLYSAIQLKDHKKHPFSRVYRKRPLVSIIIPAFNEEATIDRCLRNLAKVSYQNLEIIVSDDCSKDETRRIVRSYIKSYNGKQTIRLVSKRKNGGRGSAINAGLRRANGEIVVAFDADCVMDKRAIHKLVRHFADPTVSAVAANVRIVGNGTVLGLLQQIEYLVSFRSKKFNTVMNSEYIIGGAGASYRASVLKSVGGFDDRMKTEDIELSMRMTRLLGSKGGLKYASDYVVYTEPVPTYKALFRQRYRWKFGSLQALYHNKKLLFQVSKHQNPFTTWVRLPFSLWSETMLLLEPIYFGLFVFLAVTNKNPVLFLGAGFVFSFITWLAIFSDEHLSILSKLRLSIVAPFMYPFSFVMTCVQVVAAFRSVRHIRSITGLKQVSGAYVTTQRVKREIVGV